MRLKFLALALAVALVAPLPAPVEAGELPAFTFIGKLRDNSPAFSLALFEFGPGKFTALVTGLDGDPICKPTPVHIVSSSLAVFSCDVGITVTVSLIREVDGGTSWKVNLPAGGVLQGRLCRET